MRTVRLKNGSEEVVSLVLATRVILDKMLTDGTMELYELVTCCRDESHIPFGKMKDTLKESPLVEGVREDGSLRIHPSIRNILLSAVTGEGFDMVLRNPVEEK